jgi:4a-hydroxytetrahydrobiopterin dehydratase
MKRSSVRKKINRSQARNAMLLNQLATPGLGSLLGRRWRAGTAQLLLAAAGFLLVLIWFGEEMAGYYGQMFSNTAPKGSVPLTLLLAGAGLFAAAWCWSMVTGFSLLREASKVSLESLESFAAGQVKLDEARIALALASLPGWQRHGESITRTYQFKSFPVAMKFVNAVADLAEQAQHHPDLDIRRNQVVLGLSTHDAGGLTQKDFALARQCDAQAKEAR